MGWESLKAIFFTNPSDHPAFLLQVLNSELSCGFSIEPVLRPVVAGQVGHIDLVNSKFKDFNQEFENSAFLRKIILLFCSETTFHFEVS
jgi:hypothetical protein